MSKKLIERIRLAPEAEADLEDILQWSELHFGHGAATRYAALIVQALRDIGDNPHRPGVRQLKELPDDVFTYHLEDSRKRVAGGRVKVPRHFVLYRRSTNGIDVLRLLHESRDLARHLPATD